MISATAFGRTSFAAVAACLALFGLPVQAQQMPARAFGEGLANPVHRFVAPDSALSERLELGAAIAALSSQAKRAAPEEDVAGLIKVSRVADIDTAHAGLIWTLQKDGSHVARFEVRSDGAVGLRARLTLPTRLGVSELRVGGNRDARVEWMRVTGLEAELWTPYTDGDVQTIELRILGNVAPPSGVSASVTSLMHFDLNPLAPDLAVATSGQAKEASGSCNVDVKCPSTRAGLDADIDQRKRSVAHLQFRVGSSGFLCTGTLINSERFPRAFLLTANHCISTAAAAASLTTFWFYENTACGAADTGQQNRVQVAGGAAMLQTNYMLDSTLLEVNAQVPNGTIFAGWDAADLADNTPVVSISHPRGDPMKYSEGSITEPRVRVAGYPVDMYGVSFTRGVIEGGSSGSGLFTQSPGNGLQLRGILSGTTIRQAGGLSCTNLNELALYGRFEAFFPNIRSIIQNAAPTAGDIDAAMPSLNVRPLTVGGQVNGSIDFAGDIDVFRLDIAQPGHITVYSTGGNDLAGALLNDQGAGLVANDDAETRNNEFGFTYRITTPGVYYVSVAHWDPSAASGNYQLFAKFTSATDNHSSIWWNATESGWGLALNHQENIIAGALYTFDTDGQPQYLILTGATLTPGVGYSGNLVRPSGPPFSTIPWPTSQVQNPVVGTMQLNFVGTTNANLTYTIGGTSVTKALTRLTYATAPTCTFDGSDRSTTFNFQDIWWNPNESGWGLNIIHQGDILTVGLYTNDAAGRNVWYLMAPGTLQAGTSTYSGPLKRYTGPVFNAFPWGAVAETTVGTLSVTFVNGNQATLTYSINGASVVKQIQRFKFADIATGCKAPR